MDVIPYPRMLFRTEDEHVIVDDEAGESEARENGFVDHSELGKQDVPPPKTPEELAAETGLPVEIAGMDKAALIEFAKGRFPSMNIHPNIKLETLQGKVSEALGKE